MADGQVVFEIKGDKSGIQSTLDETTSAIRSAGVKWDAASSEASDSIKDNLINGLKAVTASAAFAKITQMLVQFGMESIEVASNLEEVQNVVDVTFGKAGAAKIEAWAKSATSQFGLTELQAKQYASTMGAMMKSAGMAEDEILDMSMNMAGLAADMSSFYNIDFDTAFMKIRSGISGETEPLKQLGINMSETNLAAYAMAQGFENAYKDMSQSERLLVRYKYLMESAADAQGDFARTSDGYANTQRRIKTYLETLKGEVGAILLPMATQLANATADFLEMLTTKPTDALTKATDEIGDAAGQATEAQGILGYMNSLYEQYGDMATNTDAWRTALEKLKEVFPDINQYIDEQTGKLTLSNEELKEYIEKTKQAAIEEAKRKAIADIAQLKVDTAQEYYTAEVNRDIAQSKADEAFASIVSFIQEHDKTYTMDQARRDGFERLMYIARSTNSDVNGGAGNSKYNEMETQLAQYEAIYNQETKNVQDYNADLELLSQKMASASAQYDIAVAALERMTQAANNAAGALNSTQMNSGQYYNYYYSSVNGSHASGLDFVPFDNYIARLHAGEGILTAEENRIWQNFKNGNNNIDYDMFGNVMRDNVHAGGNVYLDGRTVGQVISRQQAQSFRSLQRSGWQE